MRQIGHRKRNNVRIGHPLVVLRSPLCAGNKTCWWVDEQASIAIAYQASKGVFWRKCFFCIDIRRGHTPEWRGESFVRTCLDSGAI
jgi:hypothetical protein